MPQIGEIRRGRDVGYNFGDKVIWHACVDCGKERWVQFLKGKPKSLRCKGCSHANEYSRNWKGGRNRDGKGYILIKLFPNDFFYPVTNRKGYILEHRLVMAKHLGRCLLPWEVVHHKNSIRDDNRLENLELLPTQKYHIVDTVMKAYVKRQENKINKLRRRVLSLERQLFELGRGGI